MSNSEESDGSDMENVVDRDEEEHIDDSSAVESDSEDVKDGIDEAGGAADDKVVTWQELVISIKHFNILLYILINSK